MADITDKKGKKLEWYKYVVKRYLRDILQDLANSKNQMERSYYETRYACQLDSFAKALNVRPKLLEKYIKKLMKLEDDPITKEQSADLRRMNQSQCSGLSYECVIEPCRVNLLHK